MIEKALIDNGFDVRTFGRARDFEIAFLDWRPSVAIIDLGLPDKDGLAVLGALSNKQGSAILVISARSSVSDKIVGLDLGADDYLTKPFEMPELIARVRALLRRRTAMLNDQTSEKTYAFAGITVDLNRFVLTTEDGQVMRLSASEVALLSVFLNRPNRLITRDYLREQLDDRSDKISFDRAIDVRVSRLRAKLSDSIKDPKIIQTIYGAGYILIADVR